MEIDLSTIMQGLALAGILALIGWAWKMNARMATLEGNVKHGFDSGRKTMKRHSEKIETHDNEIRALEIVVAVAQGREGSSGNLRPHRDRP